jgi:hypothetical protein
LLARARPGQGITSVAIRKALVLRTLFLKDKESKRAVDIRLALLLLNFTFPCPAYSTILLFSVPSKRASPLNGFGQQLHLDPALKAISRGFVAPAAA